MQDYTHYREVFKPEWACPYTDASFTKEIDVYRKSLNGVLFIDRVLKTMGVTKPKSYPPKGDNGLYTLHQQVCDSRHAAHHKLSVLYYILLDFDSLHGRRGLFASTFASRFGVPNKYRLFMKGLWHMDRQQFSVCTYRVLLLIDPLT